MFKLIPTGNPDISKKSVEQSYASYYAKRYMNSVLQVNRYILSSIQFTLLVLMSFGCTHQYTVMNTDSRFEYPVDSCDLSVRERLLRESDPILYNTLKDTEKEEEIQKLLSIHKSIIANHKYYIDSYSYLGNYYKGIDSINQSLNYYEKLYSACPYQAKYEGENLARLLYKVNMVDSSINSLRRAISITYRDTIRAKFIGINYRISVHENLPKSDIDKSFALADSAAFFMTEMLAHLWGGWNDTNSELSRLVNEALKKAGSEYQSSYHIRHRGVHKDSIEIVQAFIDSAYFSDKELFKYLYEIDRGDIALSDIRNSGFSNELKELYMAYLKSNTQIFSVEEAELFSTIALEDFSKYLLGKIYHNVGKENQACNTWSKIEDQSGFYEWINFKCR